MDMQFENISHSYGQLTSVHDVSFSLKKGEVISLLGPSGCGKSTLLRLAAGLEVPEKGAISKNGEIISSPSGALSPDKRDIGLVFQNYALFPHLSVLDNVCYGISGSKKQAIERAKHVMDDFGIWHLADKYPHELSGGQQQRVALARAIAPSPQLLLLDEPFSGLDTRLRERVRDKLLHLLRDENIAAIMVTHDAEEAMFMSDRIVVLDKGRVAQIGRPLDVYRSPVTSFVATFFGEANQFKSKVKNGHVDTILGHLPVTDLDDGDDVEVVVRNENLRVFGFPDEGRDQVPFTLLELHLLGANTLVHLSGHDKDGAEHHFHAKIPGLNFFEQGSTVYLSADPSQIYIFPK